MGSLKHDIQLSATYGNRTYYVVGDRTLVRRKSSLTRKRVLKDKAFEKTRQYAASMGLASKIASLIYKALPNDIKARWFFRSITGEAASLLYEGKSAQEVEDMLWNKYIYTTQCADEKEFKRGQFNFKGSSLETRKKLWKLFRDRWDVQDKPMHLFNQLWDKRGVFKVYLVPRRLGLVPVI